MLKGGNTIFHRLHHFGCGKHAQRNNRHRNDIQHLTTHPKIRSPLVHHHDTLFHKTMIEIISEDKRTGANGFANEQILILREAHALLQHVVVGFVFMHITHAIAQHIHQRVPPLYQLHQREQQNVSRMVMKNVSCSCNRISLRCSI